MINRIALALTIAAISTGAAAQSQAPILPSKVIEITPPRTSTVAPTPDSATGRSAQAKCSGWNCGAEPIPGSATSGNTSLLDGCVIDAIGRLPKVDGMRVTKSTTEYRNSHQQFEFYTVAISVDLLGRQTTYVWLCRVYANSSAQLIRMP